MLSVTQIPMRQHTEMWRKKNTFLPLGKSSSEVAECMLDLASLESSGCYWPLKVLQPVEGALKWRRVTLEAIQVEQM